MIIDLGVVSMKEATKSMTLIWKDLTKQHTSMQYSEILMLTGVMHLTRRRVINYTVIDLYPIQDTSS